MTQVRGRYGSVRRRNRAARECTEGGLDVPLEGGCREGEKVLDCRRMPVSGFAQVRCYDRVLGGAAEKKKLGHVIRPPSRYVYHVDRLAKDSLEHGGSAGPAAVQLTAQQQGAPRSCCEAAKECSCRRTVREQMGVVDD